jgi:hypothetical protein
MHEEFRETDGIRLDLKDAAMNTPISRRISSTIAVLLIAALCASGPALARGGGGGGGGGHGGGFGGGFHGGSMGGFGAVHGGAMGRFGGAHGGYGGWRGGYGGWRGGYGGWGWLGYGLFFSALPYYYSTFWWDGVPYYYADDNYYIWNDTAAAYETVAPPAGLSGQTPAQPPNTTLFAYPKNGQSTEQQARDRQECASWAGTQTGFDPTRTATAANAPQQQEYLRAQAACFEARGYTVK